LSEDQDIHSNRSIQKLSDVETDKEKKQTVSFGSDTITEPQNNLKSSLEKVDVD